MFVRSKIKIFYVVIAIVTLGVGAIGYMKLYPKAEVKLQADGTPERPSAFSKSVLAQALYNLGQSEQLPTEVQLPSSDAKGGVQTAILQYAFDPELQQYAEGIFKSYNPDYGALVAIDAETGRLLSMVSYTHSSQKKVLGHLALRATFPSASVFKVVTAAAAIAEKKYSSDTVISFNGANHKLYKKSVLQDRITRWTRYMSLKEAFAKSVNPVFGKIGAYAVGAESLRKYADRFGFNRKIASDLPIQNGAALIQNDPWSLAEAASGFTRDNTMSPLQGALIAAAVANGGVMMEPYAIESVHTPDGTQLYQSNKKIMDVSVDPKTAREIRELMQETVSHGTSKKSFKGFFRGGMSFVEVGGKTGTLTGFDPFGKYDWFVGYGISGSRKIAIAALTISEKYWKVKSSYVARKMIEQYFKASRLKSQVAELRHP